MGAAVRRCSRSSGNQESAYNNQEVIPDGQLRGCESFTTPDLILSAFTRVFDALMARRLEG
jgi:hypothetical protein